MYTCGHLHTHPHSLSSFAWTHMGTMQKHAPVQPGCHGCQRFQANPFKTPQFIQTLTAKVVHKRPCETCLGTYARWFTPPPLPPDVLERETLLTALRAIFSRRSTAGGKKQTFSAFVGGRHGRWWGYSQCKLQSGALMANAGAKTLFRSPDLQTHKLQNYIHTYIMELLNVIYFARIDHKSFKFMY